MADEHEDWTPYQKMEAGILKDISCDTDRLIDIMEDGKMGEGFDSGALMGMLANKGMDSVAFTGTAGTTAFSGTGSIS